MADNRTQASRSNLMSRIKGRNTAPEKVVRAAMHRLGYRFRLHRRDLPGTPDIVLPSRRKVVFVHGCFWHAHGCRIGQLPKSNLGFWLPKLERNRERDGEKRAALETLGWSVLEVWQCEVREANTLDQRLKAFLGPTGRIRSTTDASGGIAPEN